MAKSKKTTTKKAEPKPKNEEVKAVATEEQPISETQPAEGIGKQEELPDWVEVEEAKAEADAVPQEENFVIDGDAKLLCKAVIGCSKIWANSLLASQNKYFERYFYLEKNAEVEIGTKIFADEALHLPFIGMEFWITLSTTEGEHNPKWATCQVDNNGEIISIVHL